MRHSIIVILSAVLLVNGCVIAGREVPGETLTGKPEITRMLENGVRIGAHIYFEEGIANELDHVPISFKTIKEENRPANGTSVCGGQYDPSTDSIVLLIDTLCPEVIVHEYLHRVWFKNFTEEERRAFVNDLSLVRGDANETMFNGWLDDTFTTRVGLSSRIIPYLWEAETYAYIGTRLAMSMGSQGSVPLRLRWHYRYLKGYFTGIYRANAPDTSTN